MFSVKWKEERARVLIFFSWNMFTTLLPYSLSQEVGSVMGGVGKLFCGIGPKLSYWMILHKKKRT